MALDLLYAVIDFPLRFWNLILRKSGKKKVFSTDGSRSDSESTDYSNFVRTASVNEKVFRKFRKNFYYRQILEHVNYSLGNEYLSLLSEQSTSLVKNNPRILKLSKIGRPRKYFYPRVGVVSPTILRYQYVAQEFERLFGNSIGNSISEIGVGFGGQYVILQENFKFDRYTMFDLPPVLELTNKVISSTAVQNKTLVHGNIQQPHLEDCDLIISNYAFSELPREIQQGYVDGVLKNAKRGYLIMNSGRSDISGRSSGKFTLKELQEVLPKFDVIEEIPLTGPDNYVIVWGHRS